MKSCTLHAHTDMENTDTQRQTHTHQHAYTHTHVVMEILSQIVECRVEQCAVVSVLYTDYCQSPCPALLGHLSLPPSTPSISLHHSLHSSYLISSLPCSFLLPSVLSVDVMSHPCCGLVVKDDTTVSTYNTVARLNTAVEMGILVAELLL